VNVTEQVGAEVGVGILEGVTTGTNWWLFARTAVAWVSHAQRQMTGLPHVLHARNFMVVVPHCFDPILW
jgi:hypothetical protein